MEELSIKDLFNQLCCDRVIKLQLLDKDVANLHSRLCKYRAISDADFGGLGEQNPLIAATDMITCRVVSREHLEDGTKLCVVEFILGARKIRRFTLLPIDSESGGGVIT